MTLLGCARGFKKLETKRERYQDSPPSMHE